MEQREQRVQWSVLGLDDIGMDVKCVMVFIPTLRGRGEGAGRTNYQLGNATPTRRMIPRREKRGVIKSKRGK